MTGRAAGAARGGQDRAGRRTQGEGGGRGRRRGLGLFVERAIDQWQGGAGGRRTAHDSTRALGKLVLGLHRLGIFLMFI